MRRPANASRGFDFARTHKLRLSRQGQDQKHFRIGRELFNARQQDIGVKKYIAIMPEPVPNSRRAMAPISRVVIHEHCCEDARKPKMSAAPPVLPEE